tara:strand:- start:27931 stop:28944 length:1014 start_codon:yes stop_codon:yes gene_type:complete
MKRFLFIIKTIFIILFFNSYVLAGVSTPTPTTTLNKIANSMSHSAKNNAQTASNISSATSTLLNSSKITAGIQASAAKFGLSINTEAATILAGVDTSSSASISKAMAQLESNIEGRDWDYVPTADQDTIVYETPWFALEKVTTSSMNDFTYASTHDVFKENVDQMVKGKVYVNFKKRDMWAEMDLKLTLTQETYLAEAGVQQLVEFQSGTATFNELPIVAEDVARLSPDLGVTGTAFAGENGTMKKNATELIDLQYSSGWYSSKENMISEYNHDQSTTSYEAIYFWGKFTTASEGGTALGQIAVEGGHHDDNSEEQQFVESIERQEASGSITGKAVE